jgi:simple sugar transport system substrate-binding protein
MSERGSGLGDYRLGRRQFLAGSALASAGLLLAGCRREAAQQASQGGGGGSGGNFPDTPEWNFVFVNHVTTNPFFVATQYGIEDAQALLGTTSQWTGSEKSVVSEMIDAMNTAISGNADGIAVCVVDPVAFNDPIQKALDNGIPVIAYNANGKGPGTNPALAYVGQDLFQSGVEMGEQIVDIVDEGLVALFIATPGQLNIQPRIDGAKQAIEDSGANIEIQQVTTAPRQRRRGPGSRPGITATKTWQECSPSTRRAPRASPRSWSSSACTTRASRQEGTTCSRRRWSS